MSPGIGRAIAIRLSQNGAVVHALSKSSHHLESLKREVPEILPLQVDLEDWDATKTALEGLGNIDLLVNNAGVAVLEQFLDVKPESFDKYA